MPLFFPPRTRRRNSTTKTFHCLPKYSHLRSIYWSSLCTWGGGGVSQQSLVPATPARSRAIIGGRKRGVKAKYNIQGLLFDDSR